MRKNLPSRGFTLVELMVVMSVMTILATMALYGYGQVSKNAKADTEMSQIMKVARMARAQNDTVLGNITSYCSACACWGACNYTCEACRAVMDNSFKSMGLPGAMKDPWGYYYSMDENELEGGSSYCVPDYFYYHGGQSAKTLPLYSSQCSGNP